MQQRRNEAIFRGQKSRRVFSEAEFLARVEKKPSGCWEWNRCCFAFGYGRARHSDPLSEPARPTLAHRIAYLLFKGPIPAGMTVDHICHNRKCANPAHLQLLTPEANSAKKLSPRFYGEEVAVGSHCQRGHRVTEEKTYLDGKGRTRCALCRDQVKRFGAQRRAKHARIAAEQREAA